MIGVFDSGIGGLTVVRAIMDELPGYDMVYFGDTAADPLRHQKQPHSQSIIPLKTPNFWSGRGPR